jgi:hypothetical protein
MYLDYRRKMEKTLGREDACPFLALSRRYQRPPRCWLCLSSCRPCRRSAEAQLGSVVLPALLSSGCALSTGLLATNCLSRVII